MSFFLGLDTCVNIGCVFENLALFVWATQSAWRSSKLMAGSIKGRWVKFCLVLLMAQKLHTSPSTSVQTGKPLFSPKSSSLLISTPCLSCTSVFSLSSSVWEWTDERPTENTMSYTETELRLIGQHWIINIWQCCGRGFCPLRGGFDRRCLHFSILHEYTTMSRASLPSREIKKETDRQYSSNKVHLKLIKTAHKKTLPFEFEKPQLICCVLCSWGVLALQTASRREARFCVLHTELRKQAQN